ncbi:hypothetical protein [Aquibacillus sediminis]|uniref:hypothetical protein n=1 Tax=Aquibacillus sediminis TaxID=2574734 RepID=UPI001108595D|nr:hypothetical protein [Aquibacillus sediminis]
MKKTVTVLFVVVGIFLAGCNQSEDEVFTDTKEIAETMFNQQDVETNTELEHFTLFIPSGFEVVEETTNNVTLEKGDQPYILFYNPLESTKSELNYQKAADSGAYILLEAFEDDERFGYLGVRSEDDVYVLEVGVGRVKITTRTKLKSIDDNTEQMMKMANSIAYRSHQ